MPIERLDKIISSQGLYSRSQAKSLIKNSEIKVNGRIVTDSAYKADADTDEITVSGKPFLFKRNLYIMLNKPKGVVSASRDNKQKTVVDLVPKELYRNNLFPAGRLDGDTTGFVLITDDGDFAHRILSPKNHVEKTYQARLAEPISEKEIHFLETGAQLADGTTCLPSKIKILENTKEPLIEIKICEGKYHQIKRMFASVGNKVTGLKRTKIGALPLDERLSAGECRELTPQELALITTKE